MDPRSLPGRSRLATGLLLAAAALAGCDDSPTVRTNFPPTIREIVVRPDGIVLGGETQATALVSDENNDPIGYRWTADAGTFDPPDAFRTFWTAPEVPGAYWLRLAAWDLADTTRDSVRVLVGEGSLTVRTEPPGARLQLDGNLTSFTTPHTFETLAVGPHSVAVVSGDFVYAPASFDVFVAHGSADTLDAAVPVAGFFEFDPGRDDVEEFGAITYLAGGTGILYAARTTQFGTGVYSAALNPATGAPNGLLVVPDVLLDEPLAVGPDGETLFHTRSDGSLIAATLVDEDGNGVVEAVVSARQLRTSGYGAAAASTGEVAFSPTPSTLPAITQLLWGTYLDGRLQDVRIAATTRGRRPSWRPGSLALVYQLEGFLLRALIDQGGVDSPDTLNTPEGHAQLPAWSPWGARPIAYVHGPDETNGLTVRLHGSGSNESATIFTQLFDPRGLAWSPAQRVLAVSHNPPANPAILILTGLPIP